MSEIKIRKSTLYFFGIVLILIVGFFLFVKGNGTSDGNPVNNGDNGEIQEVIIGFKNYNYYPNTIEVNANEPVRIYLDESVSGCYRVFTIRELRVSKYLKSENDYVEFTPAQKGSYRFSCSMGMGTGTLIVK